MAESAGSGGETQVRDRLALDRTLLANERTLLSYARTALALAGGGAALVHFFYKGPIFWTGWILIILSGGLAVLGLVRFVRVQRRVLQRAAEEPVHERPPRPDRRRL